jgi:hypothetical protein
MITKVEFKPAKFEGAKDDARNVVKKMTLDITLDRRGIKDLIAALVSTIEDGCAGASACAFDGTINIHRVETVPPAARCRECGKAIERTADMPTNIGICEACKEVK